MHTRRKTSDYTISSINHRVKRNGQTSRIVGNFGERSRFVPTLDSKLHTYPMPMCMESNLAMLLPQKYRTVFRS